METIEEMLDNFITVVKFSNPKLSDEEIESMMSLYTMGAKHREQVLTEWHDPKEYPDNGRQVLMKCRSKLNGLEYYTIGFYKTKWHLQKQEFADILLGWREIHEL